MARVSRSYERGFAGGPPGAYEERYPAGLRLRKPWGVEVLLARAAGHELWELRMEAGAGTSLHLHEGKATAFLALTGTGSLLIGGRVHAFRADIPYAIAAGAPHRVLAAPGRGLTVWELERPGDKEDIVRLRDVHGRAGMPFLHGSSVLSLPRPGRDSTAAPASGNGAVAGAVAALLRCIADPARNDGGAPAGAAGRGEVAPDRDALRGLVDGAVRRSLLGQPSSRRAEK